MSEFIGYIDLTDFRQISPKHSRNNDKESVSGNFHIGNICPVASTYATRLAYIYMLFAGWEVRMAKNCDRGLENAARGCITVNVCFEEGL